MFEPFDFEKIVSGAAAGGWDWFDGLPSELQKKAQQRQELTKAQQREIAGAWAAFAATPGGRKALEALFDNTLRRTVFFVQLGVPPDQVAQFGAFREGQNAVAQMIARLISIGRGDDEPVKPRETDT